MILAGDIGGTKTNIAFFGRRGASILPERVRGARYKSKEHAGLESIVADFLGSGEPPEAACFGIAGPVIDGRVETPNLPWIIDAARLASEFRIPRVVLVNDVVATAIRGGTLEPKDVAMLNGRIDPHVMDTKLVIAAGTGLGIAALVRSDRGWVAVPSEGGHADLPTHNAEQAALLAYLRERHGGHVSVERAVSGRGLHAIWDFVVDSHLAPPSAEVVAGIEANRESGPQLITEHGLKGTCAAAVEALRLFADIYGAVAGNYALTWLSTGGVLLGGGVTPKIYPALTGGRFMQSFADKGRFRELLERTPVAVILDQEAALLGAAIRADEELERA